MYSKAYGANEIRNALDVYNRHKSFRKTSTITGISKTTVHRWFHSFHFLLVKRRKFQKKKKHKRQKVKYPNLDYFLKSLFENEELMYLTLEIIQRKFNL